MAGLFGKLLYGGDYNPEQWLDNPSILEKDIEYFKKAYINEVTLGIFSWSVLESEEGVYQFEWMEKIIDRLYREGISVILATPSGARPKWMADKYPEVLRVDEKRNRYLYGFRHNHCYTSPVYREKTRMINLRLAQKFGNHPGVIAWHISNEYGGECHCNLCQEEFRKWVRKKYDTIDNLNRAWATTFWSHVYQSFDQIESPSSMGEFALHGLNLDWKRFVTERTADFMKAEIQAIRDGGSDKPVTTNLMYDYKQLDYHKFENIVDIISWDNYPQWHKKEEKVTAMDSGMQHDIMRSIKRAPYLLMESSPSSMNWQPVSKLKKPKMLELQSLQAIAHGSDSVQYFQLRQSRGASEKFHGAVIDHYGGDDTRVFKEVTGVGKILTELQEITGSNVKSETAVIFDWENRWALEDAQGPRNQGLYYKEVVQKSYYALRKQGLNVDLIDMDQSIERYKVVICPMLYMFKNGFPEKIEAFVKNGGILVITYWSGIVDETDLCYLNGTPYGLMDVCGVRSTEIDALYDYEHNFMIFTAENPVGFTKLWQCSNLCDIVRISNEKVEVLATYGKDFYAGSPAATRNKYGKGSAVYICADFEQGFYDELMRAIVNEAGITTPIKNIPDGIEVTTRENEDYQYTFIQNFNRKDTALETTEGLGECISGVLEDNIIRGFDTVIFKKEKHVR